MRIFNYFGDKWVGLRRQFSLKRNTILLQKKERKIKKKGNSYIETEASMKIVLGK